ncbi:ABC transporter permease [candidate division KSB1 bacterium]|nr:ABC transporter permease [candidate division KSB1 bacterium]
MLRSYVTITTRYLLRNKLYSFLNILGLTLGFTAGILILHFVHYEKSYDTFYPDADRIYRLRVERLWENGEGVRFSSCAPPAAPVIRDQFSQVEKIGRICRYQAVISTGEKSYLEERMYFAEPEFLDILPVAFLQGKAGGTLGEPGNAFISAATAIKYFGHIQVLGKTFRVDDKIPFQIAGVFQDIPHNSHLKYDILLSFPSIENLYGPDVLEAWGHTGFHTYLRLKPETDLNSFKTQLDEMLQRETEQFIKLYNIKFYLPMQPLTEIHLTSHFMQEYEVNGSFSTVNILFYVAIFILVIAWINYINLSTAFALNRAKEIGLRKTIGASRPGLILQFLIEVTIINLIAFILTILVSGLSLPLFSRLTAIPVPHMIWQLGWFWRAGPALLAVGILISGVYPIAVLTSYKPVTVLKGNFLRSQKGLVLRKGLVVFQFIMAFFMAGGTLAIYQQISFMRRQNLGFLKENILVIKAPRVRDEHYGEKFTALVQEFLQHPGIESVCHVTEVPGRPIYWDAGAICRAGEDPEKGNNYLILGIDENFVDVFGLEIKYGRNFSTNFGTDSENLLMNETALKVMGFSDPGSAVGRQVDYWGQLFTIVGVLKDYHQQFLKQDFSPQIFRYLPNGRGLRGHFAVKLDPQNIPAILDMMREKYLTFFPGNPFDFFFLDEYYDQQYKADNLIGRIFALFAGLSMAITALGIFGLSAFSTAQRTKEIGIRKVLGANIVKILTLLTRDILALLLTAFVITVPLFIWGIRRWLQSYAFPMPFNPLLLFIPLCFIAVITLATVSYCTVKSARAHPIDILRYE